MSDLGTRAAPPAVAPRPRRLLRAADGVLFVFAGVAAVWLAVLLFQEGVRPGWPVLLLVVFWVVVAYLVLPRLHRILTQVYVPDYFIGRTRTSDGLLGDPVNLAFMGDAGQVHAALTSAGWTLAEPVSLDSGWRIVVATLRRASYPAAPVSPLLLFGRPQDFAYQQEVAGSPAKRHHVRFWRCPAGWLLPGGFAVDWLAAGTFDRSVGLSLFTLQVTHRIEADTDRERDHVVASLRAVLPEVPVRVLADFATGYHARNGGGDRIETDGDLPVVDLRATGSVPVPPPAKLTGRPGALVFGAGVALLRALVSVVAAVGLLTGWWVPAELAGAAGEAGSGSVVTAITAGVLLLGAVTDAGLGLATLAGRGWARVLLMLTSVVSILTVMFSTGLARVGLGALPILAVSVLVLLALSSGPARAWSHRLHAGHRDVTDPAAAP